MKKGRKSFFNDKEWEIVKGMFPDSSPEEIEDIMEDLVSGGD